MSNAPSSKELTALFGINYTNTSIPEYIHIVDVLPQFVRGYNATVHSTTGMPPARVTDSDVLAIWERMNEKRGRIATARPKFRVRQHVRVSKA